MAHRVALTKSKALNVVVGIFILLAIFGYLKYVSIGWNKLTDFCTQDKVGLTIEDFTDMANKEKLKLPKFKSEKWVVQADVDVAAGPDAPACLVEIKDGHVSKILLDSPVFKSTTAK